MLGNKNRMTAHWCLTTVVFRIRRSQAILNKLSGVNDDDVESSLIDILAFVWPESESSWKT